MITAIAKKWCGLAGVQTIPDLFVLELWNVTTRWVLESKPSPPPYRTVYRGTTDDCTRIDNQYPTCVLTRVNLLEVAVTVAGTTIDRQFFDVSLRARFPCVFVHASWWSRDQNGSLTASRLCQS